MLYKLAVYKNLTNGVIALQRAELQKVRLEIARERLELLREKRLSKSQASSTRSTETASSPDAAPSSHQSGSGSRSRPATADRATPAVSLGLSTSEDSLRAPEPTDAEERREPPCVSTAENLHVDSSTPRSAASDALSFRSSDGDLRAPSEPYGIGAGVGAGVGAGGCPGKGGGPGQGEPSAAAAAGENAPVMPEREETPELDPAIPAPPPAIDYEFWRQLRSPSFVGVPRGGPSRQKPDDMGVASQSAASPRTPPPPAPQPKASAPPAVNPGAARPAPTPTRPFVPNQVRPRNPNKTITAIRPVPPLVKHNTTIRAAR
jgi:hypothetical protein